MPTRYQQLRQAIARLASNADEQHAYLESIFGSPNGRRDACAYGNDELALEFSSIFDAAGHMLQWAEITQDEIDAAKPLDAMLDELSGKHCKDFWQREALWTDPRWAKVRRCARQVLKLYPDEERPSGWMTDAG